MTAQLKSARRVDARFITQVFFFALIAAIAVNHSLALAGARIPFLGAATTHALCPFGGVVSIYQYVTAGTYVKKIHDASFILMYVGFGLALLFGPVFCGWVCPLGTVQEWIGKLGKRLLGKRYNNLLPGKLDRILRYLRYAILALVVVVTARSAQLLFENLDPYNALFAFWTGEVPATALIVLGVVLLLSLVVERPFCKYACPYGAVQGVFNLFRIFKIRRNAATCIDCSKCDRACPMNIKVSSRTTIRDHQCISCMKCTSEVACPVANTVALITGKME
jgi:polyferredoxin